MGVDTDKGRRQGEKSGPIKRVKCKAKGKRIQVERAQERRDMFKTNLVLLVANVFQ